MEGFGHFYGQSSLHPLALLVVILLSLATLSISRRFALVPLFLAATTLPMSQRIIVAGADFTLMRVLLLAYVLRILSKGENRDIRWNRVDTLILMWTVAGAIIYTMHFGTTSALINRVGWLYDVLLTYFTVRCLVRESGDLLALSKAIAIISVPIAAFFAFEWATRRNLFSIFGGVPLETVVREGKLRCQGPFAHPILAGTFWAVTLPMTWMLWKQEGGLHKWSILGTASAVVIILACASSTPILTALVGGMAVMLFRFRKRRKKMWVGMLVLLLCAQVFMDKPVWHLMARVDLVGGSTGWHRFVILQAFFDHFSNWYATGDHNPMAWGVWEMRDITNQYILEGLRGGLWTLIAFVLMLLFCFGNIGRALALVEHMNNPVLDRQIWLIGAALAMHVVSFFGVSYFGQMTMILYMQLALSVCALMHIAPRAVAEGKTTDREAPASKKQAKRLRTIPHGALRH